MSFRNRPVSRRTGGGYETRKVVAVGLGGCLALIFLTAAMLALVSFLGMLAWNIVVPSVFGGPTLNFIQAFAGVALLWLVSNFLRSSVSVNK